MDEGLGVEVGEVGGFGVGGALGECYEDLGRPGAVDGVVGLELLGVPGGGVEAAGDEGLGVGAVGDDPEGMEGAQLDHGAVFDSQVGRIGDEGACWGDEGVGCVGVEVVRLDQAPEVLIEGGELGGGIEGEAQEVGEEGAIGEPTVGVFVGEGVDVGLFLGVGRGEGDIGERMTDQRMDMTCPLGVGREIGVIGGHGGW